MLDTIWASSMYGKVSMDLLPNLNILRLLNDGEMEMEILMMIKVATIEKKVKPREFCIGVVHEGEQLFHLCTCSKYDMYVLLIPR